MRLILARHGQPDYERDCLTETGRRQARDAALRLADEGIESVYTSPFGRALETAWYTADALGLRPVVLPWMRELYWGSVDGRELPYGGHPWNTADALIAQGVDLADPAWNKHPVWTGNRVLSEIGRVAAEADRWLAGFGYLRQGLYYRFDGRPDCPRAVALFAHGGSGVAALCHMLNLPFPYLCATLHMPLTGLNILRFSDVPGEVFLPKFDLMNDGRHAPYGQGM
ncbi:MAG: histidine phosphatase family protein [Clostridia bacterium]|nr:histidine phosphatase family protein [Clostridia bacterium]